MIYLRESTTDDMDLLYKWANDPDVRKNSFNMDPIPYESHVSWFNRIMEDPTVLQYILMDDVIPVGQIRLNVDGGNAEIGYSIGSEFRGKGYGHRILQLMAEKIAAECPQISTLVAKVKPDNIASNKLFESEGYEMKYSCYTLKNFGGGVLRTK